MRLLLNRWRGSDINNFTLLQHQFSVISIFDIIDAVHNTSTIVDSFHTAICMRRVCLISIFSSVVIGLRSQLPATGTLWKFHSLALFAYHKSDDFTSPSSFIFDYLHNQNVRLFLLLLCVIEFFLTKYTIHIAQGIETLYAFVFVVFVDFIGLFLIGILQINCSWFRLQSQSVLK